MCTARDGARLAYATAGAGPPLVWTGSWFTHLELDWQSPIWGHWIEALTNRHTVVRHDLRGTGLSDSDVGDASLETWVRDLDTVIDDLGLDRFSMLGVCQGGAIAVAYAAHRPDRVSRLVLYGSYARGALFGDQRNDEAAREAQLLTPLIEHGWGRDNSAFREVFARIFMPDGPSENVELMGRLQRETASPANAARLWTAFQSLDVQEPAARLGMPALVVHTRNDAMVPVEQGQHLASLIPGAELAVLEGRNHILMPDDPAWPRFLDRLDDFLGNDAAAAPPDAFPSLTPRERQVLELMAQGASNDGIASDLGLRPKTVRNHVSSVLDKLGVARRAQAIVEARQAGFG